MTLRRRLRMLAPAVALVALVLPSASSAQTLPTRTFVSGNGNDANPCTRSAPCRTFGGAQPKTADGGIVNIMDSADYGGLTITKPLTLRARGGTGGVTVNGGTAITINARGARVTLDGLDIHGGRTGERTVPMGVRVVDAQKVKILNSQIARFSTGLAVLPNSTPTSVLLRDSTVTDNGIGVLNAPSYRGTTRPTMLTARRNTISDNTCGVSTSAFGPNGSPPQPQADCGTAVPGNIINPALTRLFGNDIEENTVGVFARGNQASVQLVRNDVVGNFLFGLRRIDGAVMRTTSPATNFFLNPNDDAPNGTVALG